MNIIETIETVISQDRANYRCFDELRRLYYTNKDFKNTIDEGIRLGKITGFDDDLWSLISSQNIRRIDNFEDVFVSGANLGYCTVASKQLSYSFYNCHICGGVLKVLAGTKNCKDGSHTWISYKGKIFDTTLMLITDESYATNLGYEEINRHNPNEDEIYLAAKDYANHKKTKENINKSFAFLNSST